MVGTWIGNPLEQSWEDFENETDNFGILEWEFEESSKKVHFLDLTISIENEKISTKQDLCYLFWSKTPVTDRI